MITTTLRKIRQHDPCKEGWHTLLSYLGKTGADDDPLPLVTILQSNGLDDALWCLRTITGHDKEPMEYSIQQLIDCNPLPDYDCTGGWMYEAYKYTAEFGIALSKDYASDYI